MRHAISIILLLLCCSTVSCINDKAISGLTRKTLCLGIDFRKSEKKEFHIRDTSKGSSERLDFSIE